MIRQSYEDSDGKVITDFKCKICSRKGRCKDGTYVCVPCKYVTHDKCANVNINTIKELIIKFKKMIEPKIAGQASEYEVFFQCFFNNSY